MKLLHLVENCKMEFVEAKSVLTLCLNLQYCQTLISSIVRTYIQKIDHNNYLNEPQLLIVSHLSKYLIQKIQNYFSHYHLWVGNE